MGDRLSTAQHCHAVLSILLDDLHAQFDDDKKARRPASAGETANKRRRTDIPSSTINNELKSPFVIQAQTLEPSARPTAVNTNVAGSMIAPTDHSQFSQPNFQYNQAQQPAVAWPEPMMSGDVGDVFGQVSWEALFQGDGSGWDDWENFGGI
jgi:hypothetical protein